MILVTSNDGKETCTATKKTPKETEQIRTKAFKKLTKSKNLTNLHPLSGHIVPLFVRTDKDGKLDSHLSLIVAFLKCIFKTQILNNSNLTFTIETTLNKNVNKFQEILFTFSRQNWPMNCLVYLPNILSVLTQASCGRNCSSKNTVNNVALSPDRS